LGRLLPRQLGRNAFLHGRSHRLYVFNPSQNPQHFTHSLPFLFHNTTNTLLDGGTFSTGYYRTETINFATTKVVTPGWHQIFLRGILANWLVTMAVFLSISAREIISKIFAIWMPVMCFVGLGTDHVIANMYFIPMAIFVGSPNISVGYYIWKSMIPSALGNIVGGGLFVGGVYWYLCLAGNEVEIHFDENVQDHAVFEQGVPIDGRVPDSAGNARSGVAKELNGSQFKKEEAGGAGSDASTTV
jgi:hypothetical protein